MAVYLYKKIQSKRAQKDRSEPWTDPVRLDGTIDSEYQRPSSAEQFSPGETDAEAQRAKRAMRIYRWRLIAGLFIPASVQALNTTMIAGALPYIASDFDQLSQLNWIISAYNLTAAAFLPCWGQLADVFGRYITLQAAAVAMILGSALCAGAPTDNFAMFLAGRGLEGVGSAGMLILSKIILADKVPLRDNAKNNTVFTFVIGVSYTIGPVIGGYLTSASWRWVFIINIPLCVIGMAVLHFVTKILLLGPQDIQDHTKSSDDQVSRSATLLKRLSTIDFGGQLFFLFGIGLLVLALTWAGSYYPWADAKVLGPLVSGVVLTIAFVAWESLLLPGKPLSKLLPFQRAMLPMNIIWSRNGGILFYINFITGMAMYAVFYFVALYFTLGRGFDSGKAGVSLIFYLPGLGVGAYIAIFNSTIWPRSTFHPLAFGTLIEALGITLVAYSIHIGHLPTIYGMLALTGVGTGVRLMPGTLHGVGYFRNQIASVVALTSFANSFGGTLASTIMLNIFNNRLSSSDVSLHGTHGTADFDQLSHLPAGREEFVRGKVVDAIVVAFYGISAFMWLGVVMMGFLGNVDIKKGQGEDVRDDGETDVGSLTSGAYLVSLFRKEEEEVSSREGEGGAGKIG